MSPLGARPEDKPPAFARRSVASRPERSPGQRVAPDWTRNRARSARRSIRVGLGPPLGRIAAFASTPLTAVNHGAQVRAGGRLARSATLRRAKAGGLSSGRASAGRIAARHVLRRGTAVRPPGSLPRVTCSAAGPPCVHRAHCRASRTPPRDRRASNGLVVAHRAGAGSRASRHRRSREVGEPHPPRRALTLVRRAHISLSWRSTSGTSTSCSRC